MYQTPETRKTGHLEGVRFVVGFTNMKIRQIVADRISTQENSLASGPIKLIAQIIPLFRL